jgi:hypothetical protein
MISGTNPINNNSSLSSAANTESLLSALGGSSTPFDSVFTQAMNQATTPAAKAEDALLEVQYTDLNTLYNAVSGGDSSSGSLLGGSSTASLALDLGSVSAQVSQLEQQLGITPSSSGTSSTTGSQAASNTDAALGLQAGLLYNQDLSGLGSSSSGASSSGINALV